MEFNLCTFLIRYWETYNMYFQASHCRSNIVFWKIYIK